MPYTLTDRERAIVELREQQKLSFRAIGERLGLSPAKTSYAYHQAARKLRINYAHALHEEQNQIMVSFLLSLGEAEVLQRILNLFLRWKLIDCRGNFTEGDNVLKDPEYLTAEALRGRLSTLERWTREQTAR